MLGFLGLHLMATGWGGWERQRSDSIVPAAAPPPPGRWLQWCMLLVIASVLYVMLDSSDRVPSMAPSRKMANATYCLWVFLHNVSILLLLELIDFMYEEDSPPTLSKAVNKNQLVVFLIANQLTGVVNLSMRTVYVDDVRSSMVVVLVYMGCVSLVAWLLRHRRIKL